MESEESQALNGVPVQDVSQSIAIYETTPLRLSESDAEVQGDGEGERSTPTLEPVAAATISNNIPTVDVDCKFSDFSTNKEKFQVEISKWEEYYDQVHQRLSAPEGSGSEKAVPKSASNFSIGEDGLMYYTKVSKSGTVLYLKVIRDYAERVRMCREIHLDTGDVTLHNRRDKMLELVGQMYFWKGQRRDVCQCIASCAVCSTGLGAKRKAKPPGQKRDIPRNGPPDPPKKKAKLGRPRKNSSPQGKVEMAAESGGLISNDLTSVDMDELAMSSAISKLVSDADQSARQHAVFRVSRASARGENGSESQTNLANSTLDESDICFQQIFTTIDESSADRTSPVVQRSSQVTSMVPANQEVTEETSIYELLFKLPSIPSNISPAVVEAIHMAMRHTPDNTALSEAAESIMRQILSLGQGHNVIISPTTASAYTVAIFASMLRMDPLSVSGQISSKVSSPLAVLHDSCCALASNSDLGPVKTCTALTGAYNWNLGDMTYPMDKDMVKMAIQSNRVAAVFYQPYAYIEKSQHISLEVLSGVCHSRGCDVAVIVDASNMPTHNINWSKLTAEVKMFFNLGADLVLMPSVDRLYGHSHSCILVGVSSLLSKVWRSIGLLQKQVCLPLLCLPHDLVGTVVTYKALQEQ